jgi:uncharacterized damage-inducible protein DinB
MKELLCQLAGYNVWANHKILYQILQMDQALWYKQTPSSFDSLYKTILHIWDAESIWWQRMRMHEKMVIPSQTFEPSLKDACNGLLHQSMEWETFIKDVLDDQGITSNLIYKNSRGEEFFQPVLEIIMHVFNHGTYHRGQLVSMMRALGETNIPATDFIAYSRK